MSAHRYTGSPTGSNAIRAMHEAVEAERADNLSHPNRGMYNGMMLGGLAGGYAGANLSGNGFFAPKSDKVVGGLLGALAGAGLFGYLGHGGDRFGIEHPEILMGAEEPKKHMKSAAHHKIAALALPMAAAGLAPTVGSIMGYRHAPDHDKVEGAYRGGLEGSGTALGAGAGLAAGGLAGGMAVQNSDMEPGHKAIALLLSALVGAGVGGTAGYGLARGALGRSSYEKKREEAQESELDPLANTPDVSDDDGDDEGVIPKSAREMFKVAAFTLAGGLGGAISAPRGNAGEGAQRGAQQGSAMDLGGIAGGLSGIDDFRKAYRTSELADIARKARVSAESAGFDSVASAARNQVTKLTDKSLMHGGKGLGKIGLGVAGGGLLASLLQGKPNWKDPRTMMERIVGMKDPSLFGDANKRVWENHPNIGGYSTNPFDAMKSCPQPLTE